MSTLDRVFYFFLVPLLLTLVVLVSLLVWDKVHTGRPSTNEARYVVYSDDDKFYVNDYIVDDNGNFIEFGYWNRSDWGLAEWKYYEESLEISGNYTVRDRTR